MHRIDTTTAQKDKFGAGKNGFTRGNPQTGVPATDLDDDYFDALQEELAGVVEGGGLTLNKEDRGQVLKALKLLFAANTESMGALAALVGAANKLPYFTGADEAALADLTAFAREILAQADAAGILSKLGLGNLPTFGTAASKDVGTGAGQIPDMSAWTGSFGANESAGTWYKMPNGIIVQEGISTPPSSSGQSIITLPIPFTSRILSYSATKNIGFFTPIASPNGGSLSTFLLGSTNGTNNWSNSDPIHWRLEGI